MIPCQFLCKLCFITMFFLFIPCTNADNIRIAGDILQVGLPMSSIALAMQDEEKNLDEVVVGMSRSLASTQALKYTINRTRPDGGELSFPSGHTSAAFHGATYIYLNHDKKYGYIALALATLTGYSRVRANRHYTSDVIAGALIGFLSAKTAKEDISMASYKDQEDTIWIKFSKTF